MLSNCAVTRLQRNGMRYFSSLKQGRCHVAYSQHGHFIRMIRSTAAKNRQTNHLSIKRSLAQPAGGAVQQRCLRDAALLAQLASKEHRSNEHHKPMEIRQQERWQAHCGTCSLEHRCHSMYGIQSLKLSCSQKSRPFVTAALLEMSTNHGVRGHRSSHQSAVKRSG